MRSLVRKNILRSLIIVPFAINSGLAQSPAESVSVSAVARKAMSVQMNDLYLSQWVQAEAGSVNGSVVALLGQDSMTLSKIRVALSQNGKVVASSDTNLDGEFSIANVVPGVYTLTAQGNGSFAMFSLVVMEKTSDSRLASSVDVQVVGTSGRVAEILRGQSLPKAMRGVATAPVAPTADPLGAGRRFAQSNQVLLDAQGVLTGRLGKASASVDMSNMSVFILKDGQEVSRVRVAADGSFAIGGLAPDCYGLVATGEQGSAVVGFCAVGAKGVVSLKKDGKVFVANGMQGASGMNIEIGDNAVADDLPMFQESFVETDSDFGMGPGFGGGGFGGGSGGGGGRGRGLGAGGLAAIGGLTALGIIAGTKDKTKKASKIEKRDKDKDEDDDE